MAPEKKVRLCLFGSPRFTNPAGDVYTFYDLKVRNARQVKLFLGLLSDYQEGLPRSKLAQYFWPNHHQRDARLRELCSFTNAPFSQLVIDKEKVLSFNLDRYDLDTEYFKRLSARGRREDLKAAISLYQGEFLHGVEVVPMRGKAQIVSASGEGGRKALAQWLPICRQSWRERVAEVRKRYLEILFENNAYKTAVDVAEAWLQELHDLLLLMSESRLQQLLIDEQQESLMYVMRARFALHEKHEALKHYRHYVRQWEGLGKEPSRKLRELYDRMRDDDTVVDGVIEILNWHPKDPVIIEPPTRFVGRGEELNQAIECLKEKRLLTFLGAGGLGKTRIALRVARYLQQEGHFLHGVYVVELAQAEPVSLWIYVAVVLGLEPQHDAKKQVEEYVQDKHILLVLDNVEHLVDTCSKDIAEFIHHTKRVKVLVTSRKRLNLHFEQLIRLEGLPVYLPEAPLEVRDVTTEQHPRHNPEHRVDEGKTYHGNDHIDILAPAVELFVLRAQLVQWQFKLDAETRDYVEKICDLLQGGALAIELAAALLYEHTLPELLMALSQTFDSLESQAYDLSERQRSLRISFLYSFEMLPEPFQKVYGQLSIFRGGFDARTAKAVLGCGKEVLELFVNHSLLIYHEQRQRFEMHETLRVYAYEFLERTASLSEQTHKQHGEFFLNWLRHIAQSEPAERDELLHDLYIEEANLRTGWFWALVTKAYNLVYTAAPGLRLFYDYRGRDAELISLYEIDAHWVDLNDVMSCKAAGRLLVYRAWGKHYLGDHDQVLELARRALKVVDEIDVHTTMNALSVMGISSHNQGCFDLAHTYCEQALSLAERHFADNPQVISSCYGNLGLVQQSQGKYEQALANMQCAYYYANQSQSSAKTTQAFFLLTRFYLTTGDVDKAHTIYQQDQEYAADIASEGWKLRFEWLTVLLLQAQGKTTEAYHKVRQLCHEAKQKKRMSLYYEALICLGQLSLVEGHVKDAEWAVYQAVKSLMFLDYPLTYWGLLELARIKRFKRQDEQFVLLLEQLHLTKHMSAMLHHHQKELSVLAQSEDEVIKRYTDVRPVYRSYTLEQTLTHCAP